MSGVVPGVEDPKLEQVEQTLKNDPLAAREIAEAAIARAAVTLTQPAATMAGYVVGNEASQNQTALDYALQQMGQATAQEAANQEASNNDVFSGVDNDETRRKIAGLAALGVLTKNGGAEETPEEKREKELNELSTITLLQQQLAAINDDLNLYGAQIEAMESRLQETEPAINNAYTLMEQQLAELDQQLREQSETLKNAQEEMRILKERQAAGEQISPERIEQLQIRIDAAREQYETTNNAYVAMDTAYGELLARHEAARAEIASAREQEQRLREEANNPETSPERRAQIQAEIQAQIERRAQSSEKITALETTAGLLSGTVAAVRSPEGLTRDSTMELLNSAPDQKLAGLIGAVAMAMAPMGVTNDYGDRVSGKMAETYVSSAIALDTLGRQEKLLEAQLTGGAGDDIIKQDLASITQKRQELQETMMACVPDAGEIKQNMTAQNEWDNKPENFTIKDNAGGVIAAFALTVIPDGGLALKAQNGDVFAVKDMTADQQKMVKDSIASELAAGKMSPTAEVTTALAAAGIAAATLTAGQDTTLNQGRLAQLRLEQETEQKQRVEQLLAQSISAHAASGRPMSPQEYDALIAQGIPKALLDKEMQENKIEKQKGLLAEIGLGALDPRNSAIGSFLFAGMAAQMVGRTIPDWQPPSLLGGLFGSRETGSFADTWFNDTNDPNSPNASYLYQPNFAGLAGLVTNAFVLGGPTPSQQAQPAGPSPAQLELQQRLAQGIPDPYLTGPKPPTADNQTA